MATALTLAAVAVPSAAAAPVSAAAPGAAASAPGANGAAYFPVTPVRIFDTRTSGSGLVRSLVVAVGGHAGVPRTAVTAVAVNITTAGAANGGYLTAYAYGSYRPGTSNVNFPAGRSVARSAIVSVDASGRMSVYASRPVAVIVDVEGYFTAPPPTAPGSGLYNPIAPVRLVDSRARLGTTTLRGGHVATIQVAGHGGVPTVGASAVIVNVTVVRPSSAGWLVAYPAHSTHPNTSTVDFAAGQVTANRAVVALHGGALDLLTSSSNADVLVDIAGWFTDGSTTRSGSGYFPVAPTRVASEVNGPGSPPLVFYRSDTVQLTGQVVLPHLNSLQHVTAIATQVTLPPHPRYDAIPGPGHLVAWAVGTAKPATSDLNYDAGSTASNLDVIATGPHGTMNLAVSGGGRDYLVDVSGYFALPLPTTTPAGVWVSAE